MRYDPTNVSNHADTESNDKLYSRQARRADRLLGTVVRNLVTVMIRVVAVSGQPAEVYAIGTGMCTPILIAPSRS